MWSVEEGGILSRNSQGQNYSQNNIKMVFPLFTVFTGSLEGAESTSGKTCLCLSTNQSNGQKNSTNSHYICHYTLIFFKAIFLYEYP